MSLGKGVTLSELLELLSHSRRRFVLYYLDQTDGSVKTDTLAEELAVWERAASPDAQAAPAVDTIELTLRHTHLPKLDDAGLVTYDAGLVTYDVANDRREAEAATVTDQSLDELLQRERDSMLGSSR